MTDGPQLIVKRLAGIREVVAECSCGKGSWQANEKHAEIWFRNHKREEHDANDVQHSGHPTSTGS